MKSKKAQFFMILLVIIAVATLTSALLVINLQRPFEETIGWRQAKIIKVYQTAENTLFYIDQSAKYAAYQSIYELGQKGGNANCGDYFGYSLWNTKNKKVDECLLNYKENFKLIFNENLNEYIKKYNEISSVIIPLDNYAITLDGSYIFGKAVRDIEIPISTEEQIELEIIQEKKSEEEELNYKEAIKEGFVIIEDVSCSGSCILNKEAYTELLEANEIAKEQGFELHVFSSYRSLEYQKALWDGKTPENYAQRYPDPEIRDNYVCNPYDPNPYQRCPHLTGKAIDIRIKGKTKNQMTSYDWERLANALYESDWVGYPPEEWHFEYGTDRWLRAQKANVYEIV